MSSNEQVRVEQCDREAAAGLLTAQLGPSANRHAGPEKARSGASDAGLLVQAFARHRTLSQADGRREVDRLRETLGQYVRLSAFSRDDPLAIRLEYATEADRLAAANALDEAAI